MPYIRRVHAVKDKFLKRKWKSRWKSWTLKLLADYQDVQNKIRSSLHAAFSTAKDEARSPTHREIVKMAILYLDAVIEEALRYAPTATTTIRTTTQDVGVLGHVIPKNTEDYLLSQGPRIFSPAFSIQDSLRSESVLAAKDRIGSWDLKTWDCSILSAGSERRMGKRCLVLLLVFC
jgi:hypothetical protein